MARVDSLENLTVDALITLFSTIDSVADPDTWLTKPRTIKRDLDVQAFRSVERPAIVVEVEESLTTSRGLHRHEKVMNVMVACIGSDEEPTRLGWKLAADVQTALSTDEKLGGLLNEPITQFNNTIDAEISALGGLAILVSRFQAKAVYDHSAANPT